MLRGRAGEAMHGSNSSSLAMERVTVSSRESTKGRVSEKRNANG